MVTLANIPRQVNWWGLQWVSTLIYQSQKLSTHTHIYINKYKIDFLYEYVDNF